VIDPLPLAQALLRCASVTPADAGAQQVLAAALEDIGFTVTKLRFGAIENLYAERGGDGPHVCFAGHTDVVPAGAALWRNEPFGGEVVDGVLYGRGACDMKGAIAAFAAAVGNVSPDRGKISLLITGDEEGEAVDGTARVLAWMQDRSKIPDFCVVGEPTCRVRLGDTIKIGRRGSLSATVTVTGRQGHVAYPHLADNPVHRMLPALAKLAAHRLDEGTQWFQPSSLQITSVDVGNPARNVIPARARALLNIRFNNAHDAASLTDWLTEIFAVHAPDADLQISCAGEAFLTKPGAATAALVAAVTDVTGVTPEQNTSGGTSDARFISRYCPVAEFGLVGATMHQEDEAVPVEELRKLADIYSSFLESMLA
jgi:succinyl-diaminopimelate desuccinylase